MAPRPQPSPRPAYLCRHLLPGRPAPGTARGASMPVHSLRLRGPQITLGGDGAGTARPRPLTRATKCSRGATPTGCRPPPGSHHVPSRFFAREEKFYG